MLTRRFQAGRESSKWYATVPFLQVFMPKLTLHLPAILNKMLFEWLCAFSSGACFSFRLLGTRELQSIL